MLKYGDCAGIMKNVITTRFFAIHDEDIQATSEYLTQCGMRHFTADRLAKEINGPNLYIQVRDMPEAICIFGTPNHFQHDPWSLMKLSEHGALIYTAMMDPENEDKPVDGFIFIPGRNIVAIHDRDEDWVSNWHYLKEAYDGI